jgi:hypothetical protein
MHVALWVAVAERSDAGDDAVAFHLAHLEWHQAESRHATRYEWAARARGLR